MGWNKDKLDELLAALRSREEEKHKNVLLWILAVIGAAAAIIGIGYAVYRFFSPDYLEDFEDEFDDDDFDDFFDDDDEGSAEDTSCTEEAEDGSPAYGEPDSAEDDSDVSAAGAEPEDGTADGQEDPE